MSLVITIIVMLILAGVVLSLTLGNNGIFKTAKMAAENYTNAEQRELAELNEFTNTVLGEAENNNSGNSGEVSHSNEYQQLLGEINQLKEEITTVKNDAVSLNTIYPVGSIYISTDLSSAEEVNAKLGGTWESYGVGRTIVGAGNGYNAGAVGGNSNVQLTQANLPSHSHSIPALTGTATNVSIIGDVWAYGSVPGAANGSFKVLADEISINIGSGSNSMQGHWFRMDASHSHSVKTNASTTGNTGSGTAFSVQDPYIVTYMYKRIN